MKMACAAALLGLCAAAPCRADELERWLDGRAQEYTLARLGMDAEELHDPELLWLADAGELPWDRPGTRLGPPRVLPPTVRISLALADGEPEVGLTLEFGFPRRFPVPRPTPEPRSMGSAEDLEALLAGEPSIAAVQRAAVRYVECDAATLAEFERDSRAYGALPELSLGGGLDGDRDVDVDPFDNVEGAQDGRGWDLSVDLEWDLGDLVMSYERIRILSEQQDRMELRARVLEEVTQRYFERQRARAEFAADDPERDPAEATRLLLEIAEITAGLDALTGGEFSRLLEGRGGGEDVSFRR
jgi:hypothetical protein